MEGALTVAVAGGGYGGGTDGSSGAGGDGGSGGGTSGTAPNGTPGGSGNTPGTTPPQGNGGEVSYYNPNFGGGGGGGKGAVGQDQRPDGGGAGGQGVQLPTTFRNPKSQPGSNGGGLGAPGPEVLISGCCWRQRRC